MPVHRLVRLSGSELALDHDLVEEPREVVPLDLVALLTGVAVRHERERNTAPPELGQAGERVGKQSHHRPPSSGVVAGDRRGQIRSRPAQALEGEFDDVLPGAEHVDALAAMARRVFPEPPSCLGDGGHERGGVDSPRKAARGARLVPAELDTSGIIEQRVVEVEEQRLHVHRTGSSSTTSSSPQPYFFSESSFAARASSGSAFASTTRANAENARRPTRTATRGATLRFCTQ